MSVIRRLLPAIAALICMMGAATARAQTTVEPTLLDVRIGQSAALAMRADRDGPRAWLPVAELASALELEVVSRTPSRVVLRRWPSRDLLVFDRDSMHVRSGLVPVTIEPGALRESDGELAADIPTLERTLRVPFEISWTDLVVSLPIIDSLPIGRRIAREQAHARLLARAGTGGSAQRIAPLARPLADGAVLDYSMTMPLTGARRTPGWSTALGLDVLGGSLEVSTGSVTGGTRLPTLASWTGVWREGRHLTQLRLGDGLGSGQSPRLGRGVMLTNAPYVRPSMFGLQTLRGDLPPGWSIEAYRNGELVAVDTVGRGSGYLLQLPVLYGENPVDLLAVGPFGQTRALSENLRILTDLLPAGRSEYSASAAQCRLRQQCVAAATADLRLGLTDRWTMRVGVDAITRDSVGWREAPYFSFVGTPMRAIAVQVDAAAQSHTRAALNIEPSRQARVTLEQQWFSADPIDPLLSARRVTQSSLYAFWRSLDRRQTLIEASLDQSRYYSGGALLRARIGLATQTSALRVQPYLRMDRSSQLTTTQAALGFEAMLLPDARRGPYLGAAMLRVIGEVTTRGAPLRQAVTLAMPLPSAFRVDAGVAMQRGQHGPLLTLTVSRDLNALRSYTTAMVSRGASNAMQSVQGSALLARQEKAVAFVTGPSLQRTGAAGVVFLDRNANGLRDAGEPPVPGVTVQIGTGFARSDADGRYRVWDLVPFVPLSVVVDSTSLPSPLWIPSLQHTTIEAGPNRFEPVDIPLVPGGVLEGRLEWPSAGSTSLPAIPLQVVDATGAVIARTTSFSDGEFVLFGVRPGRLTVRVDSAWLASRRLAATAQPIELRASDEGESVRVRAIQIATRDQKLRPSEDDSAATRNWLNTGDSSASLDESVTTYPDLTIPIVDSRSTSSRSLHAPMAVNDIRPTRAVRPSAMRWPTRPATSVPALRAPSRVTSAGPTPVVINRSMSGRVPAPTAVRARTLAAPVAGVASPIASTVSVPPPHPTIPTRSVPSGAGGATYLRVSGVPRTVADAVMVAVWPGKARGATNAAPKNSALTESWRTRDISTGVSAEIRRRPARAPSR